MKVLFVATECVPYAKTGGLADVSASLPKALRALGADVRLFLPRHRGVELGKSKPVASFSVPVGDKKIPAKVFSAKTADGVPVYFLDHPGYFDRKELYVENGVDYPDNAERFVFFSRAALEFAKAGVFVPNIFHAHDWFTGLLPVYLRTLYASDPVIGNAASVFTIHNMAYQGVFWHYDMRLTNLPWSLFRYDRLEFYGKLNLLKGGIVFADKVTTVSARYAEEIRTPEYGHGLHEVLETRREDLVGIINGADYDLWNPENDPHIAARYSSDRPAGKTKCGRDLQKINNLPETDRPIIGMVGRLAEQKGCDLVAEAFEELMTLDVQFVLLGSGEKKYQELFLEFGRKYPLQVGVNIAFSDEMAHKIEAGADLFLMPSRFEPCGLNQIYSLKYGTIPVVHAVGGLRDTVKEWNPETFSGTGFLFEGYEKGKLLSAVKRAITVFEEKKAWVKLMKNAMTEDWSWERSGKEYLALYTSLKR